MGSVRLPGGRSGTRPMVAMKRAWALLAITTLTACSDVTVSSERLEAIQRELNRRYGLWQDQAIGSYDYEFERSCLCPESLRQRVLVSITDSTVVAVTYVDGGAAVPDSAFASYFTVEGLFRQAQIGINLLADSLVVEYDAALHYPTTIVVDPSWRVLNDELALYASALQRR